METQVRTDVTAPHGAQRATHSSLTWAKVAPYFFIAPAFLILISLRYVPAASAVLYSFTNWNGVMSTTEYVGLQNYLDLFQDRIFMASLGNIALYTTFHTILVVVMAFFAAELVYSLRSSFMQTVWQIVFVVPLVVPQTVTYLVWGFVFNTQSGLLNNFLVSIGLEHLQQPWLGQSSTALWAIMFIGFPFVSSFAFLVYTSSLQSLPHEVIDASKIDGCNIWKRIFYIDLPLLRGPLALTIILLALDGLQMLTPQLVLTGGGPGTSTESPANFLYRTAFKYGEFGSATAVGVVMLLIGLVFSYFSIRLRYRGAADVNV
jgi:ABC-type sugar transport system permease subunit